MELRPLTLDDAPEVAGVIAARDTTDFDQHEPDFTPEELRQWWEGRGPNLEERGWVVVDEGRVLGVGRAHVEDDCAELEDDSCVHPDVRGRGVGTMLVERLEEWARERGCARVRAGVITPEGRDLLEGRGYRLVRHFWRMETRLAEAPAPLEVPGVEIRPYQPGADDRGLHAALEEGFADHWEQVPTPFEEWLEQTTGRADYDPGLWIVAEAEGEIVGGSLAFGLRDFGWILSLAVLKRFRGRGLGLALLERAFAECVERGFTRIGLEVDAANETGATHLYERAEMSVTRRYDWFERPA